jgi:site-specific DNA recombinase
MRGTALSRLILAVGYARRSTDGQESSIADQIKAVEKYANDHGYKILRWYIDDAISGDNTEKRHDFLRMIREAGTLRDFEVIICWDGARFGRFDSIDAGFYIHPLRKAGVRLVTVVEGVTDWNNSTDRIIGGVKQEGKHQQLLDLSANVTRGQLGAMKAGSWVGSRPYGYRIEGERRKKRLVLGDLVSVGIVQRIFREFVIDGRSMNDIARRLQAEGYASPGGRGKPWRGDSVTVILKNPAYTGDFKASRYSYGKYNTIRDGVVAKASKRCRKPEAEWIIHPNHHEAIVDRETFEKAQAILAKGKTGRSPYTPETNPHILSGHLRCGKCGGPLWVLKGGYYECGNRRDNGKSACDGTTVREDAILNAIANFLDEWLGQEGDAFGTAAHYGALHADQLSPAFTKVKELVMPPARSKTDRKRLEKDAEQLTTMLARCRENLVVLDAANIPAAQERIRQLDKERAAIEQELKRSKPPAENDVNSVVLDVMYRLYSLADSCRALAKPAFLDNHGRRGVDNRDGTVRVGSHETAAPRVVRKLLSRTGHIVCHTVKEGSKTRTRHVFQSGKIVLDLVGGVTGNLNPHHPGKSRGCCH